MALPGRKKNTSDKILDTTIRLLAEYGYANVNMRLIASEAGVALSQLTYHFVTKKKLISAVLDTVSNRLVDNIRAAVESAETRSEKVRALSAYTRRVLGDADMLRVMVDFTAQAMWDEELRDRMNGLCERISAAVGEILEPDGDGGVISPQDVSRLILGAVYGTSVQVLLGMDRAAAARAAAYGEKALLGRLLGDGKNK